MVRGKEKREKKNEIGKKNWSKIKILVFIEKKVERICSI